MRRLLRPALVIARRDYVATVWTRAFLLFLVGPLLPVLFGGLFGAIAARDDRPPPAQPLSVAMAPADLARLAAARAALAERLGGGWLPPLVGHPHAAGAVLAGTLDRPLLAGDADAVRALAGPVRLLVERARAAPAVVFLRLRPLGDGAAPAPDRRGLARGAQFAMFFVTVVLAGMLISNLVEEKSSKVIELLAAAVPVDAIFLGKLVGMLGVSVTGLAVWGAGGWLAGAAVLPPGALPAPALGWPAFVGLAVAYWMMLYLLLGALYLGIGAQAGSVREVQTLSLPLTLAQLLFFALASAAVGDPHGWLALAAAVIPWSSPFAMVARAALLPTWWPHLLALAWQAVALLLVVRVAARWFRARVLRSGPAPRRTAAAS